MNKKVVIGMSGGVDSSVAAYLLKEEGYEVIGVMLKQVPDDEEYGDDYGGCCSLSATEDARRVANKLGIPFYVWNFKKIFEDRVIDGFIDDYCSGKTPNPCVQCNKTVRFTEFLRKAKMIGADYLATGHYANVEKEGDRYLLKKPEDARKDQTYMLYTLKQDSLKDIIMPNAKYTKDEIRSIAEKIGLEVSNKKDSFEICFIPDDDHGKFIKRKAPERVKPGEFVLKDGTVVGKHKGISYYTVGQRKGLGLALGKPVFVIEIDHKKNRVILGDNEDLFKDELTANECNFIPFDELQGEMNVSAKIRYSSKVEAARITPLEGGRVRVKFDERVRAITAGQSVVFYDGEVVVGGGIIE